MQITAHNIVAFQARFIDNGLTTRPSLSVPPSSHLSILPSLRLASKLMNPMRHLEFTLCYFRAIAIALIAISNLACLPDFAWSQSSNLPQWIWTDNSPTDEKIYLRHEFQLEEPFQSAQLAATADNGFTLYLNGVKVTSGDNWSDLFVADVKAQLRQGKNIIAVEATNEGNVASFICQLQIKSESGKQTDVSSSTSWLVNRVASDGWQELDFDASQWKTAKGLGALGDASLAWTGSINTSAFDEAISGQAETDFLPRLAEDVKAVDGFVVEKIFNVPRSMGSWVSLTTDASGRLIASDQGDEGLFLITPGKDQTPTTVERLPVKLSGAQGLLWAFDALYVVVNGGEQSGLHRVTDTDNDGLVDHDEHLVAIPGGGEHGPHAVILSEDGKSLYVAAGNHTSLPKNVASSRIPMNWNEDLLLPRRWDANGHATGIMAPGGWIANINPDGSNVQVVSMGYRNQYDIALNGDGELFTYDADMEWDLGSPWYRPTRVSHATSGSEFGWRSGTGKWPTYYEDSLPPAVNIGPGSPTGIAFGYGAKFPEKYQRALYILDWTYGTIHAVHLDPQGSSYVGANEDFVYGNPLPVTDAVVGADGAFYFSAGGRGTRSSIYRVTYTGNESTAPVDVQSNDPGGLRAVRHQLEQWHGDKAGNLAIIFAHLGHEDRFIRYAARVALEFQDIDTWRQRALASTDPRTAIQAMIALARQGSQSDSPAVLETLLRIDLKDLPEQERLAYFRALELAFIRLGAPEESLRQQVVDKLDAIYPAPTNSQNAELAQLLIYLQSPSVVSKTLSVMANLGEEPIPNWGNLAARNEGYGGTVARMLENMPPSRGIHYAFALRNAITPWTVAERKLYFAFFLEAAQHPGGASFPGFLTQMREDALANVPVGERVFLDDLAGVSLVASYDSTPPQGPGHKWTTSTALEVLGENLKGRNYEAGRNLFHATSCAKCHRYNAEGGAIGPDLSTAAKKFSLPDLMDAMIEPSKAISDQYGSHNIITVDGQAIVGRVVEVGDTLTIYTSDLSKPPVQLQREDVEEMTVSKVSQMPNELLDVLNPEELKDLVAYLLSGGDRNAAVFRN